MARRRRKKEPRKVSYKLYVRRVLKEVHPGKEISMRALNIMNSFVIDALDRIATEATRMAHYDRRKTVTLRDMEFSCRLCLPDIMAKHANQKAQKTVTKFYAAKVRDRMRRTEMRRGEFAMMQMAAILCFFPLFIASVTLFTLLCPRKTQTVPFELVNERPTKS
ncbi:hypothetical protein niasHT_003709 [Heterodera trifolii]|uniref:Core Histone H2A/H2B/H3 domain-containing protein n=1 Tax=Heterodera trifolii TaxID=157864 RepID=A0ABD2MAF6_9BILA